MKIGDILGMCSFSIIMENDLAKKCTLVKKIKTVTTRINEILA